MYNSNLADAWKEDSWSLTGGVSSDLRSWLLDSWDSKLSKFSFLRAEKVKGENHPVENPANIFLKALMGGSD